MNISTRAHAIILGLVAAATIPARIFTQNLSARAPDIQEVNTSTLGVPDAKRLGINERGEIAGNC